MAVSRLKYPTFFNMSASKGGRASGGTVTTSGSYTIHTFSTANTPDWFIVNDSSLEVDILLVGGGGCGGGNPGAVSGNGGGGGGGGGGGYISGNSITLSGGKSYRVLVGAGGQSTNFNAAGFTYNLNGGAGQSSIFDQYVALGGGGGGAYANAGYKSVNTLWLYEEQNGASGGGAGQGGNSPYSNQGGYALGAQFGFSGTVQGNDGGRGLYRYQNSIPNWASGAGGGGAGSSGQNASGTVGGNGGSGIQNSISGSSTYYSSGGGGAAESGSGGSTTSGGGAGGSSTGTVIGTPGTNGQGGGGGGNNTITPGQTIPTGGSGIVIVRYLT